MEDKLLKLGTLIIIRDISKFISIIMVGITSGVLIGASILDTLYRFNITRMIWLIIIGLIFGLIYLIFKHKVQKIMEEIYNK